MAIFRSAITALIPIKDGAQYIPQLRAQIESTLTDQDEVVIVNDFSSDSTLKLLRNWALEDSRLRLLSVDKPGIANALNLGLRNATNNWVARFDVDDEYCEDRVVRQLQEVGPSTVAVFSDYAFQDPKLRFLGSMPTAVFPQATSVSLVSSQRTPHPVALLNRDAILSIGGYRQNDFPAEDLSLWLRLSRIGDLVSSPIQLFKYTVNPTGISSTRRRMQLTKKKEMLTEIGLNLTDCEFVTHNIDEIFKGYDSLQFSGLRKMLLIRELGLASDLLNKNFRISKVKMVRGIDLGDFPDLVSFGIGTINRKKFRLLN